MVDRAAWRTLGDMAQRRCGRVLPLGQAIDAVVEQYDVDVNIAPNRVQEMIAANTQPVSITGDDPNTQIGSCRLETGRECRCATVNTVDPIGVDVIWKSTGATDAGNEDRFFGRNAQRWQDLFHLRHDRIVAAAGTPAHLLIAGEVGGFQGRQGRCSCHRRVPWTST